MSDSSIQPTPNDPIPVHPDAMSRMQSLPSGVWLSLLFVGLHACVLLFVLLFTYSIGPKWDASFKENKIPLPWYTSVVLYIFQLERHPAGFLLILSLLAAWLVFNFFVLRFLSWRKLSLGFVWGITLHIGFPLIIFPCLVFALFWPWIRLVDRLSK